MSNLLTISNPVPKGLRIQIGVDFFELVGTDPLFGPDTNPPLPSGWQAASNVSVLTPWESMTTTPKDINAAITRATRLMFAAAERPALRLSWLSNAKRGTGLYTLSPEGWLITTFFAGSWSTNGDTFPVFDVFEVRVPNEPAITLSASDPAFLKKLFAIFDPVAIVAAGPVDFAVLLSTGNTTLDKFNALLSAAPRPLTAASANALLTDPALLALLDPFAQNLARAQGAGRTFALLNAAAAAKRLGAASFDRMMDVSSNLNSQSLSNSLYRRGLVMSDAQFMKAFSAHPWARLVSSVQEMMEMYNSVGPALGLPTLYQLVSRLFSHGSVRTFDACDCNPVGAGFVRDTVGPVGHIYSSPLFEMSCESLPDGVFGETYLSDVPFKITLNSNINPGRMMISAAHEMMHGLDQVAKLGLSHDQIHAVGTAIANEVFPALKRLEIVSNKNK